MAEIYRAEEGPRTEGVSTVQSAGTDGGVTLTESAPQTLTVHKTRCFTSRVSAALEPRQPKRRHKLV